jgi:hypothetical protein
LCPSVSLVSLFSEPDFDRLEVTFLGGDDDSRFDEFQEAEESDKSLFKGFLPVEVVQKIEIRIPF